MFEPNQYRELCSELHVSEEKLEEVIQMTEQEKKRKFHRPMRLGLVAAAVAAFRSKEVNRIILTRPAVEQEESEHENQNGDGPQA